MIIWITLNDFHQLNKNSKVWATFCDFLVLLIGLAGLLGQLLVAENAEISN